MRCVTFYNDCAERSCGAKMLALAATYASFLIHCGHQHRSSVSCPMLHHLYGVSRAVPRTCSAAVAVRHRYAVLLYPHGVTDVDGCLLLACDRMYSIRGAHLRATCALRTAITALERQLGLHQPQRVARGTQHVVRAGTDAQLARRAMTLHVPRRERTRRSDGCVAVRHLFILNLRQAAIHLDLRLRHCCRTDHHRRTRQHSTTVEVRLIADR